MGLSESSFYQKKREKVFTVSEMKQLISLMDDEESDDTAFEFAYFEKAIKERQNETPIPLQDMIARFEERRQKI